MTERPFRFGVQAVEATSGEAWAATARRAEALGYAALYVADHPSGGPAWGPALAMAAAATTTLRLGPLVLANDFRHPALVAQEAATLDLLSGGRLELGLGAGWMREDYEQTGVAFDPPAVRLDRLEEAVRVVMGLLAGGKVTFHGRHYRIEGLELAPAPAQRPYPPLVMGGGGRRGLGIAAREAATVNVIPRPLPDGSAIDIADATAAAMDLKIGWVREASGDRQGDLEIAVLLQALEVTDDAETATAALSHDWAPLTPDEVRECPYGLIGSIDGIVEIIQERRARWGISAVVVFERDMEAFAPVVAHLAGR